MPITREMPETQMQDRPAEKLYTIEEFLAFTETRPDGERWELIEGTAVMNPSPTDRHQQIASNIDRLLGNVQQRRNAAWTCLPGVGTRVPASRDSLPQPDVMVLSQAVGAVATSVRDDAVVLFEILSPSNSRADQAWRRRVYASIPRLEHYVVVSQRAVKVTRYDRVDGWQGVTLATLDDMLSLAALGADAAMPLRSVYYRTPLAT